MESEYKTSLVRVITFNDETKMYNVKQYKVDRSNPNQLATIKVNNLYEFNEGSSKTNINIVKKNISSFFDKENIGEHFKWLSDDGRFFNIQNRDGHRFKISTSMPNFHDIAKHFLTINEQSKKSKNSNFFRGKDPK
jgi:hypothetical protein